MKKTIIFVVLAVLMGAGLGVGGTILAGNMFGNSEQAASEAKKGGPLIPLGEFLVNLNGGYILRTEITIEVVDAKAEALLKDKVPFLKDKINSVLSNRPISDVQGEAREVLRAELLKSLNEVGDKKITDVLFVSYIYQ